MRYRELLACVLTLASLSQLVSCGGSVNAGGPSGRSDAGIDSGTRTTEGGTRSFDATKPEVGRADATTDAMSDATGVPEASMSDVGGHPDAAPDATDLLDAMTREAGSFSLPDILDTPDAYAEGCADATSDGCVPVCTTTVTSVLKVANPYAQAVTVGYALVGGGGGGATTCSDGASSGGGGGSSAIVSNGELVDVAAGGAGGAGTVVDGGVQSAGAHGAALTGALSLAEAATLTVVVGGGGGGSTSVGGLGATCAGGGGGAGYYGGGGGGLGLWVSAQAPAKARQAAVAERALAGLPERETASAATAAMAMAAWAAAGLAESGARPAAPRATKQERHPAGASVAAAASAAG